MWIAERKASKKNSKIRPRTYAQGGEGRCVCVCVLWGGGGKDLILGGPVG